MGVGGTDTARGISFQHAQAVAACLEVLESKDAELLRVEGADDVIDFEVCASSGARLRVCQAKTRKEPHSWGPAPLVDIIKRWQALNDADDARFAFLTDGSIGPEIADKLQPALRRSRRGELTATDRKYLSSKGLDPDDELLARVAIQSRQPDADVTLDNVTLRLLRLLDMGAQPADVPRAEALVNTLFRTVSTRSGRDDIADRTFTRQELSDLVGVALEVIDHAQLWTAATENVYQQALGDEPVPPSFVTLEAKSVSLQPDALAYVVREAPRSSEPLVRVSAAGLLDEAAGAIISGPAGAGKTTTLRLLVPAALGRGLLPALVSVEGYEAGSLTRLVREALERYLGCRLAPGATAAFLQRDGATLLLDGAGELDTQARESFTFDVQALQRSHAQLRVLAASRDATRLRLLNLPGYVLQGLNYELRRTIAAELLLPTDQELVPQVEKHLGDLVDNPLLFVMALGLAQQGVEARSRVELFDGFVDGLGGRPGGSALSSIVVALLRDACFALREDDSYGSDRWTWQRLLAAAMARLVSDGLTSPGSIAADQALESALTAGLLRVLPGSGAVALTHDLFCDFFAAEAVRCGQRELPDVLGEPLEETSVFLAERGEMPLHRARRVVTNPVAAARCADAMPSNGPPVDEDVTDLYARLRVHLGDSSQAPLAGVHVRVADLDNGIYLLVLPSGAWPTGMPIDLQSAPEQALRVARVAEGTTSLVAAVTLWLAELRLALAETDLGEMLAIPEVREDLPETLTRAFEERRDSLEAVCADACPSLRARILRELNFHGFHAIVLPAVTHTMPFYGGQSFTEHPLAFSFNADDVAVRIADDIDEDFIEQPSRQEPAEDWLRDAPLQAALDDVRSVLADLLPGFSR